MNWDNSNKEILNDSVKTELLVLFKKNELLDKSYKKSTKNINVRLI